MKIYHKSYDFLKSRLLANKYIREHKMTIKYSISWFKYLLTLLTGYINPKDCSWYHTMKVPGLGTVQGEWDLRKNEANYLGNVDFKGKKVLELGTASGFLSFYMEKKGADVITNDLSFVDTWDMVPYKNRDQEYSRLRRKDHIRRLNNSFILAKRKLNSKVKSIHGTIYRMTDYMGEVDIAVFGSILLHLRDPLLALEKVLSKTKETVIITDIVPNGHKRQPLDKPIAYLNPSPKFVDDSETWWLIPPETIITYLKILGFRKTKTSYHKYIYTNKYSTKRDTGIRLYTIVAHRTD